MAPGSPGWVTAERRARKSGDSGRGASSVAGELQPCNPRSSATTQGCLWYIIPSPARHGRAALAAGPPLTLGQHGFGFQDVGDRLLV